MNEHFSKRRYYLKKKDSKDFCKSPLNIEYDKSRNSQKKIYSSGYKNTDTSMKKFEQRKDKYENDVNFISPQFNRYQNNIKQKCYYNVFNNIKYYKNNHYREDNKKKITRKLIDKIIRIQSNWRGYFIRKITISGIKKYIGKVALIKYLDILFKNNIRYVLYELRNWYNIRKAQRKDILKNKYNRFNNKNNNIINNNKIFNNRAMRYQNNYNDDKNYNKGKSVDVVPVKKVYNKSKPKDSIMNINKVKISPKKRILKKEKDFEKSNDNKRLLNFSKEKSNLDKPIKIIYIPKKVNLNSRNFFKNIKYKRKDSFDKLFKVLVQKYYKSNYPIFIERIKSFINRINIKKEALNKLLNLLGKIKLRWNYQKLIELIKLNDKKEEKNENNSKDFFPLKKIIDKIDKTKRKNILSKNFQIWKELSYSNKVPRLTEISFSKSEIHVNSSNKKHIKVKYSKILNSYTSLGSYKSDNKSFNNISHGKKMKIKNIVVNSIDNLPDYKLNKKNSVSEVFRFKSTHNLVKKKEYKLSNLINKMENKKLKKFCFIFWNKLDK